MRANTVTASEQWTSHGYEIRRPDQALPEHTVTPHGEPGDQGFGFRVEESADRDLDRPSEGGGTGAQLRAGACASKQHTESREPNDTGLGVSLRRCKPGDQVAVAFTPAATRSIASKLRSTSSSVVAQEETLMRMAVRPCQTVAPAQHVPSA